jgi:hypothetical protein
MRTLSFLLVLLLAVLFVSSISVRAQEEEDDSSLDAAFNAVQDDLQELDLAEEIQAEEEEEEVNSWELNAARKKTKAAKKPAVAKKASKPAAAAGAVIAKRALMAKIILERAKTASIGWCAMYVRTAIQMAGIPVISQAYAKQYGANLVAVGWKKISPRPKERYRGDIIVFQQAAGGNIAGHIQMWAGAQWVSDFKQGTNDNTPWSMYARTASAYFRYYGKN